MGNGCESFESQNLSNIKWYVGGFVIIIEKLVTFPKSARNALS